MHDKCMSGLSRILMINRVRTCVAYTLVEMLITISVLSLSAALLLPAAQSAREAARRVKCMSNFASVGIAVQNYVSIYSHFPPSSINWHDGSTKCNPCVSVKYSLFSRILPYLEQESLYDSVNFDVSIADPRNPNASDHYPEELANLTVRVAFLGVFLCPSDTTYQSQWSCGTNIRANSGSMATTYALENASYAGPSTVIHVSADNRFRARHSSSLASITDGLSNTALTSEKLRGSDASSIFEPRRHYANLIYDSQYPISSERYLNACLDPGAQFQGFITKSGLSWLLGSSTSTLYNHVSGINVNFGDCISHESGATIINSSARSQHPGGVNVGMADGSVRFVRNGVSLQVWRALGSKAGGESISNDDY